MWGEEANRHRAFPAAVIVKNEMTWAMIRIYIFLSTDRCTAGDRRELRIRVLASSKGLELLVVSFEYAHVHHALKRKSNLLMCHESDKSLSLGPQRLSPGMNFGLFVGTYGPVQRPKTAVQKGGRVSL